MKRQASVLVALVLVGCTGTRLPRAAADNQNFAVAPADRQVCFSQRNGIDYLLFEIRDVTSNEILADVYSGWHPNFGGICGAGGEERREKVERITTTSVIAITRSDACREVLLQRENDRERVWVWYSVPVEQRDRVDRIVDHITSSFRAEARWAFSRCGSAG